MAILEYLEAKYPDPPIPPKDLLARAWVGGFALIKAADSHRLIVPRIPNYLANVLKVNDAGRTAWIQHWRGAGLQAMEEMLAEKSPGQVLPRRASDRRRYLPREASDACATIRHQSSSLPNE